MGKYMLYKTWKPNFFAGLVQSKSYQEKIRNEIREVGKAGDEERRLEKVEEENIHECHEDEDQDEDNEIPMTEEDKCKMVRSKMIDTYFFLMTQMDNCTRVDLKILTNTGKEHRAFTYPNGYGMVHMEGESEEVSFHNQVTSDPAKNILWGLKTIGRFDLEISNPKETLFSTKAWYVQDGDDGDLVPKDCRQVFKK